MSIEKIILQPKFKNEYHKLAINLLYTGNWLYNQNALRLKKFKLTPEQYNVLRILRGQHPNPVMLSEITKRMIDKSSNATRLVEKLKQKSLLNRTICEQNRRQVDITITDKGLSVLLKIDKEEEEWLLALKGLNKKEATELNLLLDKLRQD